MNIQLLQNTLKSLEKMHTGSAPCYTAIHEVVLLIAAVCFSKMLLIKIHQIFIGCFVCLFVCLNEREKSEASVSCSEMKESEANHHRMAARH